MSNSLDPEQARHFVGLVWVQTVCKSYKQATLVGKELMCNNYYMNIIQVYGTNLDSLQQFCNSFPNFMIELFIEDNNIIK